MTWQNKGGDIKDYLRETIKEMKARITELETENRRYKELHWSKPNDHKPD